MYAPGVPIPVATLVDLLRWRAINQPTQRAYTFLEDHPTSQAVLTYAQLDVQARSIAAELRKRNAANKRILLLYPPSLEYIAGFFGCLYAGAIAVPAYPPDPTQLARTLPRLRAIVDDAQPILALTTKQIAKTAKMIRFGSQLSTQIQTLPLIGKRTSESQDSLHSNADDPLVALEWLPTDGIPVNGLQVTTESQWESQYLTEDSLAFLQYTSGSTGTPKGVMISHGNLLHNSSMIHAGFGFDEQSEGVIWLPMYHDMGLIGGVLQPLVHGFHCTLMSPLTFLQRPLRWLQAISDIGDKKIFSGGPDFAYTLCIRRIKPDAREKLNLRNWQLAFTGAEPIRSQTLDAFADAFAPSGFRRTAFYPAYGLAESTLFVTGGKIDQPCTVHRIEKSALKRNKVVSATRDEHKNVSLLVGCGLPQPDLSATIVNPETRKQCAENEIGEIWISSPSVAKGYWNRDQESEETFRAHMADTNEGPFLRTGDLGYLHHGELFIAGRYKDLIIIRGRNHYPQDIEQTVEQCHSALRSGSVAAFAIDVDGTDEKPSEQLVIVQESRKRKPIELDEIIGTIRQVVAQSHELRPYAVVLAKQRTLPKTSSGKIQRSAIRSKYLNGDLDVLHSWQAAAPEKHEWAEEEPSLVSEPKDNLPASTNPNLFPLQDIALNGQNHFLNRADLENWLSTQFAAQLHIPLAEIDNAKPVSFMGLDSLMIAELKNSIQTDLGVDLPLSEIMGGYSITNLATILDEHLTQQDSQLIEGEI